MESNQLQPAPGLADQHILAAQLKSLRYASSRSTRQTTVEVTHSTKSPEIANADLVMALAMAAWRMKSLHPAVRQDFPQRLPGFQPTRSDSPLPPNRNPLLRPLHNHS